MTASNIKFILSAGNSNIKQATLFLKISSTFILARKYSTFKSCNNNSRKFKSLCVMQCNQCNTITVHFTFIFQCAVKFYVIKEFQKAFTGIFIKNGTVNKFLHIVCFLCTCNFILSLMKFKKSGFIHYDFYKLSKCLFYRFFTIFIFSLLFLL